MRYILTALLVSAALTAFGACASAADLPPQMYTKAPAVAPLSNWTGFYIGLNAGGSWGSQDNSAVTTTGVILQTDTAHPDGFIGGGQIGYNWQINQWVFGLEADFQGSSQSGDGAFNIPSTAVLLVVPPTLIAYTDKLDWFGTVRGRIGYAWDRWLPYVTGGWAFGHGKIDGTTTIGAAVTGFSANRNYSGWTIGGGIEWAFANNWSAKLEYLYIDFGDGPTVPVSAALNLVGGRMTDNIVRAGLNYKFN